MRECFMQETAGCSTQRGDAFQITNAKPRIKHSLAGVLKFACGKHPRSDGCAGFDFARGR